MKKLQTETFWLRFSMGDVEDDLLVVCEVAANGDVFVGSGY